MDCDVVIVGSGLAGAAAAWELSGRGHSVILLEANELGHRRGSSHGTSRIYRRAYVDGFYVELTGRAEAQWERLECDAGRTLRTRTGGLDTGATRDLDAMALVLRGQGVEAELLAPEEAQSRWPGMLFEHRVLHHPAAGYLDPDATIAACVQIAVARGAKLVERAPAVSVDEVRGGVVVHTAGGSYSAGKVVLTPGAWLPDLLPAVQSRATMPALQVKQQEVFHFRQRDPLAGWPTFVHKEAVELYGLPSGADGGSWPAVKIGQFDSESDTCAGDRDFVIDPRARSVVREHVERWLPGLDPEPVAEQSCLFTMTPDQDFVLDRSGDVVIASVCSGHGAKFAPLTGVLIADLVEGAPALARFAFRP